MAPALTGTPAATAYTLEFVLSSLPKPATDVLEIGCGAGELAAELASAGCRVIAIDADEQCVEAARARGVDARVGTWPYAVDERVDAVLFTRSLHHIHDLDGAVDAARSALRPGGRIIVEDFRAEGGSERSTAWYLATVRLLEAAGALDEAAQLASKVAHDDHHEHELHGSAAIEQALSRKARVEASDAAYYFRYFEPHVPARTARALLAYEVDLISAGSLDPLGRRFMIEI